MKKWIVLLALAVLGTPAFGQGATIAGLGSVSLAVGEQKVLDYVIANPLTDCGTVGDPTAIPFSAGMAAADAGHLKLVVVGKSVGVGYFTITAGRTVQVQVTVTAPPPPPPAIVSTPVPALPGPTSPTIAPTPAPVAPTPTPTPKKVGMVPDTRATTPDGRTLLLVTQDDPEYRTLPTLGSTPAPATVKVESPKAQGEALASPTTLPTLAQTAVTLRQPGPAPGSFAVTYPTGRIFIPAPNVVSNGSMAGSGCTSASG